VSSSDPSRKSCVVQGFDLECCGDLAPPGGRAGQHSRLETNVPCVGIVLGKRERKANRGSPAIWNM
jgi:hypothetical protein